MSSLQRKFMLIGVSSAYLKLPPFIRPNFLIISQFVLAGQLSIARGERGSNLLHLFTFGFFVWRHSPTEGHQNSRRWIGYLVQKASHWSPSFLSWKWLNNISVFGLYRVNKVIFNLMSVVVEGVSFPTGLMPYLKIP